VRSDVPALVLAGSYDPITPPAWSRMAAGWLSHSTYVELPGVGHGASRAGACPEGILSAFLEDPTAELDTSCVKAMPEPRFVTHVYAAPGVYRFARALFIEGRPGARVFLGAVVVALAVGLFAGIGALRAGRVSGAEHRVRLLVGLGAALALLFLVGLVAVLVLTGSTNPYLVGFGVPPVSAPLFWLPAAVALVAGVALAVGLPAWSALGRATRVAVAVGFLGLGGFLLFCRGFGLL
jgi:hypothetical protein